MPRSVSVVKLLKYLDKPIQELEAIPKDVFIKELESFGVEPEEAEDIYKTYHGRFIQIDAVPV